MKNITKALLTLAIVATLNFQASAQPGFDDDVEDSPIDGGISLVIGCAIAYGAYKKRKAES